MKVAGKMNDAQFNAIKKILENSATTDVHMSAQTWDDFKRLYWPGHDQIPPGAVRVWVKPSPRKPKEGMPYGACVLGQPDTGYRVR